MTRTELLLSYDPSQEQAPTWAGTLSFVLLVLALSATQLLPTALEQGVVAPPDWLPVITVLVGGGFSTVWAVLIVGGVTMGWSRLRRLLRTSLRVRADLRLYLVALFVPLVLTAGAAGLAALLTGTAPALATGARPQPLQDGVWAWLTVLVLLAPLIVLSENLGWRAWLQRGLQVRWSPLIAGVVVGVVWSLWHLPLWETDPLYAELHFPSFLLATTTRSVLLAALFNASRGSVVPVVVAHWAFNGAAQLSLPADLAETVPLYLALAAVSALSAALVARWSRARATEERAPLL